MNFRSNPQRLFSFGIASEPRWGILSSGHYLVVAANVYRVCEPKITNSPLANKNGDRLFPSLVYLQGFERGPGRVGSEKQLPYPQLHWFHNGNGKNVLTQTWSFLSWTTLHGKLTAELYQRVAQATDWNATSPFRDAVCNIWAVCVSELGRSLLPQPILVPIPKKTSNLKTQS